MLAVLFLTIVMPLFCTAASFYYTQGEAADIKVPCMNNGTYCSGSAICNATILAPNDTTLIDNQRMTNALSYHNYTMSTTQTADAGEYTAIVMCLDNGNAAFDTFKIEINAFGQERLEGSAFISLGILLSLIALVFFFMFLSNKLSQSEETFAFSLFFFVLSLICSVVIVYTGYILSRDYLMFESLAAMQSDIFVVLLYSFLAFALIAFIFYVIKIVNNIMNIKAEQKYGDNWDNKKKEYM